MIAGVESPQEGDRIVAIGAMPAGQRHGVTRTRGAERRERHDQDRSGRFDRRADQALGGDHLEPGRQVEAPAEARLGDERIEHVRPYVPRSSRVIFTAFFFALYQFEKALALIAAS